MHLARLLAALLVLAIGTAAHAACGTRWVDSTGSDTANDCLVPATPCATIQHGVDQACAGDTIEVAAGTYAEQVTITKADITVNGNGATVKPTTVTPSSAQGSPCGIGGLGTAIVLVSGVGGVTLNDLNVDGLPAGAASPPRYVGIYYRDASGTVSGGSVTNVRYNPLNGVQSGVAILVNGTLGNAPAVDVTGVTVSGYQKAGIVYNGCGCAATPQGTPTGTVSGSSATGTGPTGVIAQNGIQVGFGAGPVTVSGNTANGHFYTGDPANGDATGILLFSTRNDTVSGNEAADNNNGITVQGGSFGQCLPGDSTGNTATCNALRDNAIGVLTDALMTQVHMSSVTGNTVGADGSGIVAGSLNATGNWWGCAAGPGNPGCDAVTANVDASSPLAAPPGCVPGVTTTTSSTSPTPTTTSTSSTSSSSLALTTTTTSSSTTSTTTPGCDAAPRSACQPAPSRRSRLRVFRPPGSIERLAWSWKSSAVVSKADFGNPSTLTSLALCLYEDTGGPPALRMNARIPADGACANNLCWRDTPTGYRYRDLRLTPDGIRNVVLRAGDPGKGRIRARGKGANLHLPPFLTPPLLMQLQRTDASQCWEATFSIAMRNDGPRFFARSD